MKCQITLSRFWVILAEVWHVDKPATPPIVPNIKSKSYLNLLLEYRMESHQGKERSHLVFLSEYPTTLLRTVSQ